jgi:hypothetical protein
MCCTNLEYSKVSLEAVNKPFYGFSQYMCNSVEVVRDENKQKSEIANNDKFEKRN